MRIVFLGTPESAVPALRALLDHGHDVPLVVTRPDRPSGRTRRPVPPPIARLAIERGVPCVQPERIRDAAFQGRVAEARPELLVVVAYGRILPGALIDLAPLGAVNVHFSLLPAYRGAAPVQWALALGEEVTGVTTMRLNERLDEGDLLMQRPVPIGPGEHAPELMSRLAGIGAELLLETVRAWGAGGLVPAPQDPARATYAPILRREDGWFDPRWTAREIEGRVRGFDPWPGVWGRCAGRRLRLVGVEAVEGTAAGEPGTIESIEGNAIRLACGGGSVLRVLTLQPEGRRAMTGREALNGRQLAVGDRLEAGSDDD